MTSVLFDGCTLDVVGKDGIPILKPWKIVTTSQGLVSTLFPYRCPKDHMRTPCQGQFTDQTGFYTTKLSNDILRGLFAEKRASLSDPRNKPRVNTAQLALVSATDNTRVQSAKCP